MKLVIVESPTKSHKIAGFLGPGWRVEASRGHVRDLPEAELGVDVESDFRPTYTVLPGKGNVVKKLLKAIKEAEAVYVATDPDREGEAIAWHLLKLANVPKDKPVYRAAFHAITQDAVREAITHPRALDINLVEAQQARRIVDRLVGYLASPLAAKVLDGKYSAGRVQSGCLRLVVEREREIAAFTPQPYWTLALKLAADGAEFTAKLHRLKGADGIFSTREPLDKLMMLLNGAQVWVGKAGQTVKPRQPLPPFTTSSLQQAASKALGLSPDRTMALAQTLYEGGLITYMRTDGASVAPEAQTAARATIHVTYGADYLPPEIPIYTVKTAIAQEAHEAIRPTDVTQLPEAIEGDGAALYALIWKRFIASQMAPALYTVTGAVIYAGKTQGQPFPLEFRASGRTLVFDGFLKVYEEPADEGEEEDESRALPPLATGQTLTLVAPLVEEHQTRAPARYTEAALVAALEQRGIGRPSTYASMVKVVKDKGYVKISQKRLVPTENGMALCDFLTAHFADVLAYDYTARLEESLDRIAAGDTTRLAVLQAFWAGFQPQVGGAAEYALGQVKARQTPKPLTLHPAEE
ncbi:MAG: type I DNA topoisomerase [Anaerolineaceae bacterium]|nr:type I DNA topoisomerase [Anaerolineaceae bacterium]